MDIEIGFLNDYPESIDVVARWHYGQWRHIMPGFTLETYREFLSTHYDKGGIGSMFVAVEAGRVIGTAGLDDTDMDTHPELSPWLESLYVAKGSRNKGVGSALVRRVIEEAARTASPKLYLFTHDEEDYFKRFGFRMLFREDYYGERESVMALVIEPHTPSR